jgi:hypothetical protein
LTCSSAVTDEIRYIGVKVGFVKNKYIYTKTSKTTKEFREKDAALPFAAAM